MPTMYDLTKVNQTFISIDEESLIENVDVRYSLTIPFLNRKKGVSVGIVLMNPSIANANVSDGTVNKLINFFYTCEVDGKQIEEITICNVLPVYASNTVSALTKIRSLHEANIFDKVQESNVVKMSRILENNHSIVLSWGKPEVKTIPNLLYYKEALRIVNLLSRIQKNNLYVFDIKNAISTFTEHGDPRHAGRSVTLQNLKKISILELFGLK